MGDALETAGEILRKAIVKGIRDQRWHLAPLSAATILAKARQRSDKRKGSNLILIDQGDYLASFTTDRRRWDEVDVGTNHPQGRALEFGYEPRNLPARPHMAPAIDDSMDEIYAVLREGYMRCFGVSA